MHQYFFKTVLLSIVVMLSLSVYGDDYTGTQNNGEEPNTTIQTQDNGGTDNTAGETSEDTGMHTDTVTAPTSTSPVLTSTPPSNKADVPSTQPKEESPEERAYQEKMVKISNAITQKITEIQKKQSEIDSETFPAYVPPLQSEKNDLNKQLHDLEMQRDQYQAQKTAQDLQKQLNKP